MKTYELSAVIRPNFGKKAAKEVRKTAQVPAVIYGGEKVQHLEIDAKSMQGLIYTPEIFLVNITIEGKSHTAIIKDMQFHPVSDLLLHIDFMEVSPNKPIIMEVPLRLEGLAEGVKQGGKLSLETRKLRVKALYANIPEFLTINVDALGLGKTLQVGDLSFPNLELLNAKNAVVCAVKLTRAAKGAKSTDTPA